MSRQLGHALHGGDGVSEESILRETVYYGICQCGWKSPILRADRMAALDDFAEHINYIFWAYGEVFFYRRREP